MADITERNRIRDLIYKDLRYLIVKDTEVAKGSRRPVFTGEELNELADYINRLVVEAEERGRKSAIPTSRRLKSLND